MDQRISFAETTKGFTDGLMKSGLYLKQSGLDLKLLELVYYRVSQINGCAYCLDMHHQEAIHLGETELRLHTIAAWRECPYFTEEERAVLAFAEAVTHTHITDEVFDNLIRFYNKQQVADLTLAVTNINSWNQLNITFRSTPGHYRVGLFG